MKCVKSDMFFCATMGQMHTIVFKKTTRFNGNFWIGGHAILSSSIKNLMLVILATCGVFADDRGFEDEFDLIENEMDREFVEEMKERVRDRCIQIQTDCLEASDAKYCHRLLNKTPGCKVLFESKAIPNRVPAQVTVIKVPPAVPPLPPPAQTTAVTPAIATEVSKLSKPSEPVVDPPKVESLPTPPSPAADGTREPSSMP